MKRPAWSVLVGIWILWRVVTEVVWIGDSSRIHSNCTADESFRTEQDCRDREDIAKRWAEDKGGGGISVGFVCLTENVPPCSETSK